VKKIIAIHWAWDTLLLEHTGYSEEEYVKRLENLIHQEHLGQQSQGTPEAWANIDLVNKKLALAGLRLADLLNETLGKIPTAKLRQDLEKHSQGM